MILALEAPVFTQGHWATVSLFSLWFVSVSQRRCLIPFIKLGSVCNRVGIHSSFREITLFQTRCHSAQTGVLGVLARWLCDGNTSGPSLAIESLPHPLSSTLPVIHLCSIHSGPSPITPHSHQQLPRPRLISRRHALKLVREELNFPPGQPGSLVTTGRQQCFDLQLWEYRHASSHQWIHYADDVRVPWGSQNNPNHLITFRSMLQYWMYKGNK